MSPDGTRIPPPQAPTLIDAAGVVWSISWPNGWAVKNGVATNGHATEILFFGGAIYCKSPTGGIWWKYLGGKAWLKLTTADPAGGPPPPGGHGLTATLDFGGGQVAQFSAGVNMGDFVGEFVRQKCYLALDPAFPDWRVFFRPDADATRDEVVVEYGRTTAGVPKNIGKATPYTATIKKSGTTVYTVTVPGHYWYARWRWKSSERPVVRDVATLKARALIPNVTPNGLYGLRANTSTAVWNGPMKAPSGSTLDAFSPGMVAGGDNDAIGLMTEAAAQYAIFGGQNLLKTVLVEGEWSSSNWATHYRDNAGLPLDVLTTRLAFKASGGAINDLPGGVPEGSEPGYVYLDAAHLYASTNMPWLLTDDPYFLEGLHGAIDWVQMDQPSNNFHGLMRIDQTRGYAWGLRDLFLATKTTPAVTPSWIRNQAYWQRALTTNLAFAMKYVTGPSRLSTIFRTWTITAFDGPWQTAWLNSVVGQAVLMGFAEWKPVFDWAVDGHIQMTNGKSGWPRQWPAPYYWFPKKSGGAVDIQIFDLTGATDATSATSWADAWAYYAAGNPGTPSASDLRGIPVDQYDGGPQANWDTTTLYQKYGYQGIGTLTHSHCQSRRAEMAIAVSHGVADAQDCFDWMHAKTQELFTHSPTGIPEARFSIDPVSVVSPPTGALSTLAAGKVRKLGLYANPLVYGGESIVDDSGTAFDPVLRVMYAGLGGHGPCNANDLRAFTCATLSWSSLYPSTLYSAMTLANMDVPFGRWKGDNKPMCRHTYGTLVVLGARIYCMAAYAMPYHPAGSPDEAAINYQEPTQSGGRIWSYDLTTGLHTYSSIPLASVPWSFGAAACPDPVSGKIVVVGDYPNASGSAAAWLYDPVADTIQVLAQSGQFGFVVGSLQNKLHYDSAVDRFLSISNRGIGGDSPIVAELTLNRTTPSASTFVTVTTTGQVPVGFAAGFGWDQANRIAGGGINGGKFWLYNAATRVWTQQQMVKEADGLNAAMSLGSGTGCEFDAVSGCYIFMAYWQGAYAQSNIDGNAYAYRPG